MRHGTFGIWVRARVAPIFEMNQVGVENMVCDEDDIVAIATPPGRGGVSIIRLSGPHIPAFAHQFLGRLPKPRMATFAEFKDAQHHAIDHGLALYFPAPNSYTGEHVLELHGHGSPIAMQLLVKRCLEFGLRLARPGEFSERAFLNGRLDLAQAEAVSDLIESQTEAAAKSAFQSLKGRFSDRIEALVHKVTELRIYVEAAIDFPEEEIDFLADGDVQNRLDELLYDLASLLASVKQGQLLRDGLKVVLTGLPNAGKSSVLNALSNEQRAIVSAIAGTTRDVLEQVIQLDGLPIEILDTAGVRHAQDEIEAEGVRRAVAAQRQADLILLVVDDSTEQDSQISSLVETLPSGIPSILVRNKIDLSQREPGGNEHEVSVSALTGEGMEALKSRILDNAGYRQSDDSRFIARARHLDAINRAQDCLKKGRDQLVTYRAGELLAEDLLACQHALGEITGEVTSDDLLGLIFGSFCIGK